MTRPFPDPSRRPGCCARVRAALVLMVMFAGILPATADIGDRQLLLTPQIIIPLGSLGELAGAGSGFGVDWLRPLDPELSLMVSGALLGFSRQSDAGVISAVDGMMGLDPYDVEHESEVIAVPFLVGVKYASAGLFASFRVGDLMTRTDERTALYFEARRDAGFRSKTEHGVLLAASAGIERGEVPFAGVQLFFAPGTRGPRRQSNFTWLSVFVSL